ncbi:MAG: hypothetical protein ACRDJW_03210 [Thermomicrobiales bacterium]
MGMQKNFPLGPLAYAVIEQYGELARTALTDAVRWRQMANGCVDGGTCAISGRLFADEELASQPLQPGNWLSIGLVGDGVQQAVIEINLTDGRTREKTVHA